MNTPLIYEILTPELKSRASSLFYLAFSWNLGADGVFVFPSCILGRSEMQTWLDLQRNHDPALHRHALHLATIAAAVTTHLGYSRHQKTTAAEAALLHDVGKIRISAETLRKPSPLSIAEMQIVRRHPDIGVALLARGNLFNVHLLHAIQQHREDRLPPGDQGFCDLHSRQSLEHL